MTETNATPTAAAPVFPPGRYGHRRAPRRTRRWLSALLVAAVVVAGVLVTVQLYRQYGAGDYHAQLLRFYDVTDEQVVVEFTVRVPAGEQAICVLRARAVHGGEVGREQIRVTPPAGVTRPTVRHQLATSQRPVTGEVQRCWRAR